MSKIDLGLVGIFPWTNINELYTFPTNSHYTASGGYKVVNGICYIDVVIEATGSARVTLPSIKSNGKNNTTVHKNATGFVLNQYETGDALKLTSNIIDLVNGDYINIYGWYETNN